MVATAQQNPLLKVSIICRCSFCGISSKEREGSALPEKYILLHSMTAWGGGGLLPYKRLMGMCSWMGSHFHEWIDYFKRVTRMGSRISDFWG